MGKNGTKTRQGNFAAELHFGKCLIFIVFFALFFAACRNNTTCLPINGGGGSYGSSSGGNPNNPSTPLCSHVWSDWVRTGPKGFIIPALPTVEFFTNQETTRTCDLCGAVDIFTPSPAGTGGTISGGSPNDRVKYTNPIVNMDMMWIPGGSFMMGSPDTEPGQLFTSADNRYERPRHRVTLNSGFYMSKTAITRGQWRAVMGTAPIPIPVPIPSTNPQYSWHLWGTVVVDNDNLPATHVTWYEAIVFANRLSILSGLTVAYDVSGVTNWLTVTAPTSDDAAWNAATVVAGSTGYRLPTEAQWEYAARAGTQTAFNDGVTNNFNNALAVEALGIFGLLNLPSGSGGVQLVRQRAPNAWGLYDMHGNVWEWAWDWIVAYPNPPVALGAHRVIRGGSWVSPAEDLRSARRNRQIPEHRANAIGFRLVRPAP